jgi:hypothetical protein
MATRKLKAVPEDLPEKAPDLRSAVKAAVDAMDWLQESDQALKVLALRQAEEIEKAIDRAEELEQAFREAGGDPGLYKRLQKLEAMCDVTKTVGWLGPQLQGVLRDLGGTPAARKAMKADKPIGGRLADLRAAAAGQHEA